ncbi:TetR/AcrR family transcriptional regulator [Arthrobacter sp. B2a2-09]|nr:TetR/AcrR family transcriptional regulator [Arthrobacter sp. B2a2-09]
MSTFGESGFHGASMAEIARRAEVSHTGLLHHFPRKEDLLSAVLQLQDERSAEVLEAYTKSGLQGDPILMLRGMVVSLDTRVRLVGLTELAAVLTAEASNPAHPAHEHFRDRYATIRRFMTRIFQELANRGELDSRTPPAILAATTIAVLEGLQTQWLYDRDGVDVDGAISEYLAGIIPRFGTSEAITVREGQK